MPHHIDRVDFQPRWSKEKQCYGISIKWWQRHKNRKFYFIPRIYDAPVVNTKKKIKGNRLVIGWLLFTLIFYWPGVYEEW